MRYHPLIAVFAMSLVASAAERSYIQEFQDALKIEKSAPEAATQGMLRGFHLAVAAGNAEYATAAGRHACFLIHNREKTVEAGKLAREVIDALDALPAGARNADTLNRAQFFGLIQTGLQKEGRLGEAWRANRATAETLRGKTVTATADGPPITLTEASRLPREIRSLGWRLLREEADLLDLAGRTVEARALLDEAAAQLRKEWPTLTPNEQFYAYKLMATRAMILDFLGYDALAIQTQRELAVLGEGNPNLGSSYFTLQLNLLRNLSQWDGPSEAILTRARGFGDRLKASGSSSGVNRLLAKMELDLRDSPQALDTLREDAQNNASLGHLFDCVYAERDLLVKRSAQGEAGLEAEFTRLLASMRAQGNKRGEPTLYREYGNYLLARQRPAEAIAMYAEALRLTRSFGWTLHEPPLISALFTARFAAGDFVGARASLAELEQFLNDHPDLPDSRRVAAEVCRAIALARCGDKDAAKAALQGARQLARDLPDFKKRWLTPEAEAAILKDEPAAPTTLAVVATAAASLSVSPLEIVSVEPPGGTARTRFEVINPGVTPLHGQWIIDGPGTFTTGGTVRCDAGKAPLAVNLPQSIATGERAVLGVSLGAAAGVDAAQVRVAWQTAGQSASAATAWDVTWNSTAADSVVLDASSLEANPFRHVCLFHELAVPAGEEIGIPFRLRSPVPLRLEYYDCSSQQLLAIDANGNGDFTEPGDLYVRGPAGVAAAIAPATSTSGNITVEIHIFAPDGLALPPAGTALTVQAEVYRNGAWSKQAEDTLE